jgi:hypothetical protein
MVSGQGPEESCAAQGLTQAASYHLKARKARRRCVLVRWGLVVDKACSVVQNGFAAGLGFNLGLDLAQVLLHLPKIVFGQHDRMPAVGVGHGPLWTIGLACHLGETGCWVAVPNPRDR